jgi:hypothetical protein
VARVTDPAVTGASRRAHARSGVRVRWRRTTAACGAALLAACNPGPEARAPGARAADSIVALATREGTVFRGAVSGRRLAVMVHACAVYDLADPPDAAGERRAILTTDFYPWPSACTHESIAADTAWLTVHLGRTAFGAGGCCATGGTYRTRDLRAWERRDAGGRWAPVSGSP